MSHTLVTGEMLSKYPILRAALNRVIANKTDVVKFRYYEAQFSRMSMFYKAYEESGTAAKDLILT